MTRQTASRLAKGLLELHARFDRFDFELDTAENAKLLAEEFENHGCEVLLPPYGTRMNVSLPQV